MTHIQHMLMVLTYLELNSPHAASDQEDISLMDRTVGLKEVRLQKYIKEIATGDGESMNISYMTNLVSTRHSHHIRWIRHCGY